MANESAIIRYTQPPVAQDESRWLRLDQEESKVEAATVAEAAALIDSLYGLDACVDGLAGGGKPVDDTETPAEETFDEKAVAFLGPGICQAADHWTAYVLVLRSHQGAGVVLRSETATVGAVEPVERRVSETLDFGGRASADLSWPYAGGLRIAGLPAGVTYTVRGSTLNLSAACERLSVSYQTRYERVALRVPIETGPEPDDRGELSRPERQDAALIAFWGDLAAACTLHPPEVDRSVSQTMVGRYCRGKKVKIESAEQSCTQTIQHVMLCQCSGRESQNDSWEEVVECDCGEYASGAWLGRVRQMDGYVPCEGEDDDLAAPEYYKKKCCEEPQKDLPQCQEIREPFQGGMEIEGGPEYYQKLYGPNVRLEAVTPEGGSCGEIIRRWELRARNCCLDVLPLRADPGNPNQIKRGDRVTLKVLDGRPGVPFVWRAYGGLIFERSGTDTLHQGTDTEVVIAAHNICHQPWVTVDDGCKPVTLYFEGNDSDPPVLGVSEMTIDPDVTFAISVVRGGVPPFLWYCNDTGVELQSQSEDGRQALFRTGPEGSWCTATVYCNDVCGKTVSCEIKNGQTGYWRKIPIERWGHDRFSPPGKYTLTMAPYDPGDYQGYHPDDASRPPRLDDPDNFDCYTRAMLGWTLPYAGRRYFLGACTILHDSGKFGCPSRVLVNADLGGVNGPFGCFTFFEAESPVGNWIAADMQRIRQRLCKNIKPPANLEPLLEFFRSSPADCGCMGSFKYKHSVDPTGKIHRGYTWVSEIVLLVEEWQCE